MSWVGESPIRAITQWGMSSFERWLYETDRRAYNLRRKHIASMPSGFPKTDYNKVILIKGKS